MDANGPPGRIPLHLWQDGDFRRWYTSCPPEVRHLAAIYPYGTRYLIKGGSDDWYMPHRYLEDEALVMIRYSAESGHPLEEVTGVLPEDLLLCTEH